MLSAQHPRSEYLKARGVEEADTENARGMSTRLKSFEK